ncbi:MAG: 4Fe-4S binding protein [Bacteroidales bacterium]|nr:4Fe-4S binding protein [Bacteroidales bacterium]
MKGFLLLKWLRVVISLFILLFVFFLFIDFANTFSSAIINGVLYFQFVPSILKFINLLAFSATGFILIFLLTILFGRVYCSTFCPLGTLQDVISFVSKKIRNKKFYEKMRTYNWLRYSFLVLVVIFLVFGSVVLVNLLDPYSNFGKIVSNLLRPIYYSINNVIVFILEKFEIYTLYRVNTKSYNFYSIGVSLAFLGLVGYLSYKHGRLYCNTVCPVGTLLGMISRYSLFKIKLDDSLCTSCGICGANCKSGCIDTKAKKVDFTRCVGCFNCLTVCPSNGVTFKSSFKKTLDTNQLDKTGKSRRKFFAESAATTVGVLSLTNKVFGEEIKEGMIPVNKEYPITPPGSRSIQHFNNFCTACHLCISSCPTHVLQPSITEYGLMGLFQPTMDYHASFCNFECVICSEVCPTGAILTINLEEKKTIQLGKTNFIKENCIVYTDETICGACSEHCPTKAVNMVFYKDKLTIPEVTQEICVGCGACEYACPTTPKSIYVDGNPIHLVAEKPKEEKILKEIDPEEDFPF